VRRPSASGLIGWCWVTSVARHTFLRNDARGRSAAPGETRLATSETGHLALDLGGGASSCLGLLL